MFIGLSKNWSLVEAGLEGERKNIFEIESNRKFENLFEKMSFLKNFLNLCKISPGVPSSEGIFESNFRANSSKLYF